MTTTRPGHDERAPVAEGAGIGPRRTTFDLRDFYDGEPRPSDAAETTEAFRRAGMALAVAGGGTLAVPPGRWTVRSLERDPSVAILLRTPGTTLRGAGILASAIVLEAGHDCHVVAVTAPGVTIERLTVVGGLRHQPPDVLTGAASPAARRHGISLRECPAFSLVRDVVVTDVVGYGIGSIITSDGVKAEADPFVHIGLHNVTLRRIGDDAVDFKIDVTRGGRRGADPAALGWAGPRAFLKNVSVIDHSVLGPNAIDGARGENGLDARGQLHVQNIEVLDVRPGAWGRRGGAGITLRDESGPGGGVSSASHGPGAQWTTVQNYHVTIRPRPNLREPPGDGLIVTPTIAPVVSVTNGTAVRLPGGPRLEPVATAGARAVRRTAAALRDRLVGGVPAAETFAELEPTLAVGDYSFFDVGAGEGASVMHYRRAFGGRGLGIEVKAEKVTAARRLGRPVVQGNLFDLPDRPLVRYVTADNVLEHLPSIEAVEEALRALTRVATDFVYVRHPSFEDEEHLRALDVSATWVHRTGHRAHVRLSDFVAMATRLGIDRMEIHPVGRVLDTSDPEIVPLGAPTDDLTYDPSAHGPKPEITFDREVFYAFDILFHLRRRPTVRLVHEQDPATSRARPVLVHEVGARGWRRPDRATVERAVLDAARSASRRLPPDLRRPLRGAFRRAAGAADRGS